MKDFFISATPFLIFLMSFMFCLVTAYFPEWDYFSYFFFFLWKERFAKGKVFIFSKSVFLKPSYMKVLLIDIIVPPVHTGFRATLLLSDFNLSDGRQIHSPYFYAKLYS